MFDELGNAMGEDFAVKAGEAGEAGAAQANLVEISATGAAGQKSRTETGLVTPTEADATAEKARLMAKASEALQRLIHEAEHVSHQSQDYFMALGLIPGAADIKNSDRVRQAYRDKIQYFHPDKSNVKVKQILGEVGAMFPDLINLANQASLACESAAKVLNEAGSFLENDNRRANYLAEKYGIHPGVDQAFSPASQFAPDAKWGGATSAAAEPKVGSQRASWGTRDRAERNDNSDRRAGWAGFDQEPTKSARTESTWGQDFDQWQTFMNEWYQTGESEESKAATGSRGAALVEKRGRRILSQLVSEALAAIKEASDVTSLKVALEKLIESYQKIKAEYQLPKNGAGLPLDILILAMSGFAKSLEPGVVENNRQRNSKWSENTPEAKKSYLEYLANSIGVLVNMLKPKENATKANIFSGFRSFSSARAGAAAF